MANEITIQASLTVRRCNPAVQGCGSLDITQTGKHCICNIQKIGYTGAEQLVYGDIVTLGYLFVKNLDSTNYVQLSLNDFTQIFAKLRPNECCLIPVNQNTIYAKANTADVDVHVCAAEL